MDQFVRHKAVTLVKEETLSDGEHGFRWRVSVEAGVELTHIPNVFRPGTLGQQVEMFGDGGGKPCRSVNFLSLFQVQRELIFHRVLIEPPGLDQLVR